MNGKTKNHKVGIFAIFIASALMLGTISVSGIDTAFAGDSKDKDKDKHESKDRESNSYKYKNNGNGNEAEQEIEQSQASKQSSQCVNAGTNVTSIGNCNNIALQLNNNTGSNAIGQE